MCAEVSILGNLTWPTTSRPKKSTSPRNGGQRKARSPRPAPSPLRRDAWVVAIGGEIAGIVLLCQHKFDHGNLPLLIGLLVGIAVFAIAGSLMWKAANKHDPASKSDTAQFFFQNQLARSSR